MLCRVIALGLVLAALLLAGDTRAPALAQSPGLEAIGACGRHVSGPGTYAFVTPDSRGDCSGKYYIAFEPLAQTTFNVTVNFDDPYGGDTTNGQVRLQEGAGRDGHIVILCITFGYACNNLAGDAPHIGIFGYLQARTYTLAINGPRETSTSGSITIRDLGGVNYAAVPSTDTYIYPGHPTTAGLTAILPACGEAFAGLPAHVSVLYETLTNPCYVGGGGTAYRTFTTNTDATYTFTVKALGRDSNRFVDIRQGHGSNGAQVTYLGAPSGQTSSDLTISGVLPPGDYTLRIGGDGTTALVEATGIVLVLPATIPGPPTGIIATSGDRTATLSWTAPTSDGGSTITSYEYSFDNITYTDVGDVLTVTLPNLENGTVYVFHIRAVNSVGAGAALNIKFVAGEVTTPVTSFDITLSPGANLISLPLVPDDIGIETVLTGILDRVETVWQYDTSGAVPRWRSYAPGAPSDLRVMRDGLGYWVLLKDGGAGDTVLTVTGREETGPARRVARGWNLVGFTSTSPQSPGEYLGALGGSAGTTMVGYAGGAAVAVLPSAAPPQLIPGRGYWLYVEAAGTIGGAPPETMAALVALYNATGGANWGNNGNWLSNAPMGDWHGVITDSDGRVTHLDLRTNQLTGEIPAELGNLTKLELLSLYDNQLTGEIPAELGDLANLTHLYLSGNQLTGEIPAELGNLANLQTLHLYSNQLTGEIPAELGSLTNLEVLWLHSNRLTGEIPAELGDLANLTHLALSTNQLTGEIPAELGDLSSLRRLGLGGNQLTGEIPAELGSLTNLTHLALCPNGLRGPIVGELGSLSNLTLLSICHNSLTGPIPSELGRLTNLKWLDLTTNNLIGPIPSLGNLTNLEGLQLAENRLTGPIPPELGNLSNLTILGLWSNQLTGEIPAELGSLTNLERLDLSSNQLTGEIPAELGSLTNLERLWLSGNQLTGCIPEGLRNIQYNDFGQLGLPFCGS